MTNVSIIVVSYNTLGILRDCLHSLMVTEGRTCDVIVVDNASNDGSADMVGREFSGARLIRNDRNTGFAKAVNQGIKISEGEYILLLNGDTLVRAGAIDAMASHLKANARVGAVACRLLNEDGTIQASISRRLDPLLLFFRLLGVSQLISADKTRRRLARFFGPLLGKTVRAYLAPYVADDLPLEVENISAACLMLRAEAVNEVGFLDERFFMYLEDADYCLRLRAAGWKLHYLPAVAIVHLSGRSSGGRMRNYSVQSYRSLFQFYRKHFSPGTELMVRSMVATLLSVRWVLNWVKSRFLGDPIYRQNQNDLGQIIRLCFATDG